MTTAANDQVFETFVLMDLPAGPARVTLLAPSAGDARAAIGFVEQFLIHSDNASAQYWAARDLEDEGRIGEAQEIAAEADRDAHQAITRWRQILVSRVGVALLLRGIEE